MQTNSGARMYQDFKQTVMKPIEFTAMVTIRVKSRNLSRFCILLKFFYHMHAIKHEICQCHEIKLRAGHEIKLRAGHGFLETEKPCLSQTNTVLKFCSAMTSLVLNSILLL
jgi:hypothetical protein